MGWTRGSLALPRMNAQRLVIINVYALNAGLLAPSVGLMYTLPAHRPRTAATLTVSSVSGGAGTAAIPGLALRAAESA